MGEKMNRRTAQRGLSMLGFLFVAAVAIVMIGFRTLPSYIEYFTVKKVMQKTLQDAPEPFSLAKFRSDFDLKASADYIDSVRGTDIDVVKEGNAMVATATWTNKLHMVGNVSIVLDFEATVTK
jgi:hypothetical protein